MFIYYIFFWESIQVLRRGVRKIVFEMVLERFVFAHSCFCFAPLQVLASGLSVASEAAAKYSDRHSLM